MVRHTYFSIGIDIWDFLEEKTSTEWGSLKLDHLVLNSQEKVDNLPSFIASVSNIYKKSDSSSKYQCQDCGATFSSRGPLKRHQNALCKNPNDIISKTRQTIFKHNRYNGMDDHIFE